MSIVVNRFKEMVPDVFKVSIGGSFGLVRCQTALVNAQEGWSTSGIGNNFKLSIVCPLGAEGSEAMSVACNPELGTK
jgi:hypothetical protein